MTTNFEITVMSMIYLILATTIYQDNEMTRPIVRDRGGKESREKWRGK